MIETQGGREREEKKAKQEVLFLSKTEERKE
jgi:hypothetical protein